jgi:Cytochrome P450
MSLGQRPSLWHHILAWDRKVASGGACRLVTESVLVTDPALAHQVMTSAQLYREQSAFLRTRSWDPLPSRVRNAAIRGLMASLDGHRRGFETVPSRIFPGRRGVVTQAWGIRWMRQVFRDALASDRSALFDEQIDRFVERKILGDDIGGKLRRMPARDRDELHMTVGKAIVEAAAGSSDRGDLVDVIASLDFDLPVIERGELYVRLLHSVISFTGIALEWAVLTAARNDEFRTALRTGRAVRPFLWELQRLYPTAWRLVRVAATDHRIGQERVNAGDNVIVATSALHRGKDNWTGSKEYRSSRWDTANASHDRAFMPFGRGRGMCPGREVALEVIEDSARWIYDRYEVAVGRAALRNPYVRSVLAPPRVRLRVRRRP